MFGRPSAGSSAGSKFVVVFAAVGAGVGSAFLASWVGGWVVALILLEPILFAAALALPSMQRDRFLLAGWAGALAVAFTLSGLEARGDRYDPAATFVFGGVILMVLPGAVLVALNQLFRMDDSWKQAMRQLRQYQEELGGDEWPLDEPLTFRTGEHVMRQRWEKARMARERQLADNPLTTVEGWLALRQQMEPEEPSATPNLSPDPGP